MTGFKKRKDTGKPFPTDNKPKGSVDPHDAKSNGSHHDGVDHAGAKEIKEKKMKKHEGIKVETKLEGYSKERIDREYDRFLLGMTPFGSGDIANAIEKAGEVNINGSELAELVRDWHDDVGGEGDIGDVDINYVLYDYILQMARNKFSSVLDYDFINDYSGGGSEFYVYGNYMATSYDYSEEAQKELQDKIKNASNEELRELGEDKFVKSFVNDVDIELSNKGRTIEDDE